MHLLVTPHAPQIAARRFRPPLRRLVGVAATTVLATGLVAGTAASAVTVPTATAPTAVPANVLAVDTDFPVGSVVTSVNGLYALTLQTDGNLVEYGGGRALWNTGTYGTAAAFLRVQSDGNVVLYTSNRTPVWNSATFATGVTGLAVGDDGGLVVTDGRGAQVWGIHPAVDTLAVGGVLAVGQSLLSMDGEYRLSVQADGNVVVYTVTGVAVWSTGTRGTMAGLFMQGDGNLVLYRSGGGAAWSSGTPSVAAGAVLRQGVDATATVATSTTVAWRSGVGTGRLWPGRSLQPGDRLQANGATMIMQTDGNLVTYADTGGVLWATFTSVVGTAAVLQADGNLVLYGPAGAVWSTGTWGTAASFLSVSAGGRLTYLGTQGRAPVWVQGPPNWTALARCESGGNPRAVNPAGYYGLYQFDLATWTSNGGTGNPVDATPATQTAVAATLYLARNRQPWPVCGQYL